MPMGGATNIGRLLGLFGAGDLGVSLAELCDEGKEGDFRHGLAQLRNQAGCRRIATSGLPHFLSSRSA